MKDMNELKDLLRRIDHKGYPAYKDTKGIYQFTNYILDIEHIQGDPFASPSNIKIIIKGKTADIPEIYYNKKCKRIMLQDYLLRQFGKKIEKYSFLAKGSGKSGLMSISKCGQEILERSACQINAENGDIIIYQTDDGLTKIDVKVQNETVWLSQQQMAELFSTSRTNVIEHINNIYLEEELDKNSTCQNFRQVHIPIYSHTL